MGTANFMQVLEKISEWNPVARTSVTARKLVNLEHLILSGLDGGTDKSGAPFSGQTGVSKSSDYDQFVIRATKER